MSSKSPGNKSKSRVHVISRGKGWAVKSEGASKADKIYSNKPSAIKKASKSSGKDVIVHKRDGSIQKWIKGKK